MNIITHTQNDLIYTINIKMTYEIMKYDLFYYNYLSKALDGYGYTK